MGRAFEYRKARKMKRWGHMARVFTKIGKEIEIAVKASEMRSGKYGNYPMFDKDTVNTSPMMDAIDYCVNN